MTPEEINDITTEFYNLCQSKNEQGRFIGIMWAHVNTLASDPTAQMANIVIESIKGHIEILKLKP